jgi:hypothetical protein
VATPNSTSQTQASTANLNPIPAPDGKPTAKENTRFSAKRTIMDIRAGLGKPMPKVPPVPAKDTADAGEAQSDEQEASLKSKILTLWQEHDQCEADLPRLLYELCKMLHAPGRKGEGFEAWLKANNRPKSTAYRWIRKYTTREGLNPPFEQKAEPKNSSQVARGSTATPTDDVQADYIPVPVSVAETKKMIEQALQRADASSRRQWAKEILEWLSREYLQGDTIHSAEVA